MRKPEQRLWDRMRTALGPHVRLERVENVVTVGMPDVVSCVEGSVVWVELKAVEALPHRPNTPVLGSKGLSQEQKNWHLDWARWGGRSYVLVGVFPKLLFFVSGTHADQINAMSHTQLLQHSLATSWQEILTVIK